MPEQRTMLELISEVMTLFVNEPSNQRVFNTLLSHYIKHTCSEGAVLALLCHDHQGAPFFRLRCCQDLLDRPQVELSMRAEALLESLDRIDESIFIDFSQERLNSLPIEYQGRIRSLWVEPLLSCGSQTGVLLLLNCPKGYGETHRAELEPLLQIITNLLVESERYIQERLTIEGLVTQRNNYLSVYNSLHDALVVANSRGVIQSVNTAACQLFGYEEEELLGSNVTLLMAAPYAQAHDSFIQRYTDNRGITNLGRTREVVACTKSGQELVVEINLAEALYGQQTQLVAMIRDVTERSRQQRFLELERHRLKAIFSSVSEALIACDAHGQVIMVSPSMERLFPLQEPWHHIDEWFQALCIYGADGKTHLDDADVPIKQALAGNKVENVRLIIENNNGARRVFRANAMPLFDSFGEQYGAVLGLQDISELAAAYSIIEHQALHDSLTGLPNRNLVSDRIEQALTSASRHNHCGAVLFVDLDHFMTINDSLGHSFGDMLLKQLCERLTHGLRSEDTLCRLGGDEFLLLAPQLSHDRERAFLNAQTLAEKIRDQVMLPFRLDGEEVSITASIGVVMFPEPDQTVNKITQFADTAVHEAKKEGRDRVVFFHPLMTGRVERQLQLQNQLRLSQDFYLNVQPQFDNSNQIIGGEVLLRCNDPDGVPISPEEFIPVMEASGLINEVGQWVIAEACRHLHYWHQCGFWHDGMQLGVNLSSRQLRSSKMVAHLTEQLKQWAVEPSWLSIEVVEDVMREDVDEVIETLNQFRSLGCGCAMDDFGTGYSSLSYLSSLPIDVIKIDKAFISDIDCKVEQEAVVKAVFGISQAFNLSVVAEGVETEEEAERLRELGCGTFQGYLHSRPVSLAEFAKMLSEQVKGTDVFRQKSA